MNVKITNEAKKWLKVADMPIVRQLIKEFKEIYDDTATDAAKMAAAIIGYSGAKVFESSAEIARNANIFNYWNESSEYFDVWITFSIFDQFKGFVTGGAYLSDIWQSNGENSEELKSRMFLQIYKPTK